MDIFRFLTWHKIKLLFLLKISYFLSYFLNKNIRWGTYVSCSVEGSSVCNLSCPECPTGLKSLKRISAHFPVELYHQFLEEKWRDLIYLNFYFQGEPFLNKQLPNMIRDAADKRIYTSVSTNANLINEVLAEKIVLSGLNRLIISIDGTTQESYEQYRKGGRLDKVLKATEYIQKYKKKHKSIYPKIVFQFLVFRHNENEIQSIKTLAEKYKIDKLELKTAQIYDFENKEELIPTIDRYSRYRKNEKGEWVIKNKLNHKCWRMWHSSVITQNGDVVPCCFDKDADFQYGNINETSLKTAEKSTNYKNFRQLIQDKRSKIEMCKNCTEGMY